ncbi:hypothetical protein HK405_004981, partial [Cladochytrium tenue]
MAGSTPQAVALGVGNGRGPGGHSGSPGDGSGGGGEGREFLGLSVRVFLTDAGVVTSSFVAAAVPATGGVVEGRVADIAEVSAGGGGERTSQSITLTDATWYPRYPAAGTTAADARDLAESYPLGALRVRAADIRDIEIIGDAGGSRIASPDAPGPVAPSSLTPQYPLLLPNQQPSRPQQQPPLQTSLALPMGGGEDAIRNLLAGTPIALVANGPPSFHKASPQMDPGAYRQPFPADDEVEVVDFAELVTAPITRASRDNTPPARQRGPPPAGAAWDTPPSASSALPEFDFQASLSLFDKARVFADIARADQTHPDSRLVSHNRARRPTHAAQRSLGIREMVLDDTPPASATATTAASPAAPVAPASPLPTAIIATVEPVITAAAAADLDAGDETPDSRSFEDDGFDAGDEAGDYDYDDDDDDDDEEDDDDDDREEGKGDGSSSGAALNDQNGAAPPPRHDRPVFQTALGARVPGVLVDEARTIEATTLTDAAVHESMLVENGARAIAMLVLQAL